MTITEMIVEMIYELKMERIPKRVIDTIKTCILDYLGVTYAGAFDTKENLIAYLDMKPYKSDECTIIGLERRGSIEDAALLNGISSHFFELDDGSRFGMVHLGAPVLSALFAISDVYKISYDCFVHAVLVGYEIAARLASAIQPSHKKLGFHATGTCGCIGATAAVAVALNLDKQSIANSIAAAAASASGLLEMIEDVSQLKPFNAGKAAQNAITSVFIGSSGFSGPIDPIGGKRGFLNDMSNTFNKEWFTRDGEKQFAILGIYQKPYASCRHCHPAVEAALSLADNIIPSEIKDIIVNTYELAVFGHNHTEISGTGSAKMSIPYSVAAALYLKTGGMNAMSEKAISDINILTLAKKVHVRENKQFSALVPHKRVAEIEIYKKDGDVLTKRVDYPKGEPENPMNKDELVEKFKQLVIYSGRDEVFCEKMIECIDNLEDSYQNLLRML